MPVTHLNMTQIERDEAGESPLFRLVESPENSVTIRVDGVPVLAQPGETVAAVLLRLSPAWSRRTHGSGERRAPYCMMGVCFDCLVSIDGTGSTRSCLARVCDGMQVERQDISQGLRT
ncbi:(2Fe-2S)-binding protein [Tropicimonas sp. IMCC34011]|uniref:(2Fe-2S)-binding protein n=1 Tax=Tropicimonas sp. IMCC34011 TaxID=2248759 RepID=UPI001E2D498F|nr:(2Fe-2S)-binding protein [Tropicimonas sp. IMCC34011]